MGELTARVQQVTEIAEKAVVEQAANVEAAVGEVNKLQAEGVAKAGQLVDKVQSMVPVAREKLTIAAKITAEWGKQVRAATGEWGKQVLAATRTAAEAFTKLA
jgi:hypothetical protein